MRPSPSLSRPSTSQSHYRPGTSQSHNRPGTSQSQYRPGSRISQTSASRLSHRPPSRHAQRLAGDTQTLVTQLTGMTDDDDPEDFQDACDSAGRILETHRYTGLAADMRDIDTRLDGLTERADIQGHDALAKAISETRLRLKRAVGGSQGEDDCLMKNALLPQHIQFLLSVSMPLSNATHEAARNILHAIHNPPPEAKPLTWADIVADEPFEGQHWDMISSHSTSSDESWSDDDRTKDTLHAIIDFPDTPSSQDPTFQSTESSGESEGEDLPLKDLGASLVETLRREQYWTEGWRSDIDVSKPFHMGDPSTLAPAIAAAPYAKDPAALLLGALDRQAAPSGPHLAHMSIGTYHSILTYFASVSTTVLRLKSFVKEVYREADSSRSRSSKCRTLHAFAEGLDHQLTRFTSWCADKEEMVCLGQDRSGTPLVVSLLGLQHDVRTRTASTFEVITRLLDDIALESSQKTPPSFRWDLSPMEPATLSKVLLDGLLSYHHAHLSIGDETTAGCLLDVFAYAVSPTWRNIYKWLKSGASLELTEEGHDESHDPSTGDEFFVRRNDGDVPAERFWAEAFVLRTSPVTSQILVPSFLLGFAQDLLWAGKAIGLLRAMSLDSFFYDELGHRWMDDWPARDHLILSDDSDATDELTMMKSIADRARDNLWPFCQSAQARLNRVLVEDCRLWEHLECIEDMFLMGRGDVMTQFCGELFQRSETGEHWSDYHMLNGLLKDAVTSSPCNWIDVSLLRLSYRSVDPRSVKKTVRGLEGMSMAYQISFPLNYLFSSAAMEAYSSVFVFLLQLRWAKYALESVPSSRGEQSATDLSREEKKAFYALRAKLSWIVGTLTNYLMTYVLHVQVLRLHQALRDATSLDHMISIHSKHLRTVETEIFMMPQHITIRRNVLHVLDLCVQFRSTLARFAFTRDASTSILNVSVGDYLVPAGTPNRKTRKNRLRQSQKRYWINTIGDVSTASDLDRSRSRLALSNDTDSSDDDDEHLSGNIHGRDWPLDGGQDVILLSPGESFGSRVEEMSAKLDTLVRHVQKSVEGSAPSESEAAFSVLSFMLEDWDP
ncbi:hypothetical protein FRB96_003778 [Tulasnella sp. 330]|nr:hypothetical protein FRB96_003778 [Tulasnella sp. 330]